MALLVCLQKVLFRSIQSDQAKSYVVKMVNKFKYNLWAQTAPFSSKKFTSILRRKMLKILSIHEADQRPRKTFAI